MDRFTHSSAPVKKVKAVQFGILDPDFIVSVHLSCGRVVPNNTVFVTLPLAAV